jgi:hypothetical protein
MCDGMRKVTDIFIKVDGLVVKKAIQTHMLFLQQIMRNPPAYKAGNDKQRDDTI